MTKLLKIIPILILISACSNQSYIWRHPDHVPQAQFNRDRYECERDSSYMYTPPPITSGNYSGPPNAYSGAAKGFEQGYNMGRRPTRLIDHELYSLCMQTRGYYKEIKRRGGENEHISN